MIDITDRESLEAWLETRSQDEAAAIAARCALRVTPRLVGIFASEFTSPRARFIFPAFRATSASAACVNADSDVIRDAAAYFAASASAAANAAADAAANAAADAAAYSAANAAAYAYSAAAAYAYGAAYAYAAADAYASAAADAYAAAAAAVWAAIRADAALLEAGLAPDALMDGALWTALDEEAVAARIAEGATPEDAARSIFSRDATPAALERDWTHLHNTLLAAEDEDWGVWTDWYEDRLNGRPVNRALQRDIALIPEDIWTEGPKRANAEIRRLMEEHKKTPTPPAQELAPIVAAIHAGRIDRDDPDAPPPETDMAQIHAALRAEAHWLNDNLSAQHGGICDLIGNAGQALGARYQDTDQLMLGFWSKTIAALAAKADEELIVEKAARLQGFSANLDLFVARLQDWKTHLAKAASDPVTPEEARAGAEAARSLLDQMREMPETFAPHLTDLGEKLYLALADGAAYGPETAYGFYRSLMNVLIVTAQAALDAIPAKFVEEEKAEALKQLRKNARAFIFARGEEIMKLVGSVGIFESLRAAIRYILGS